MAASGMCLTPSGNEDSGYQRRGCRGNNRGIVPGCVPHKQAVRRTAVRVAAVRNPMLALETIISPKTTFYENRFEERR